jgi:hypothetical protein
MRGLSAASRRHTFNIRSLVKSTAPAGRDQRQFVPPDSNTVCLNEPLEKAMKLSMRAAVLAACVMTAPAWAAVEVAGVKFEDSAQINNQALTLNGAGVRTKVIIDVYAAGLYVTKKDSTAQGLLAQPGAKSVQIGLLMNLSGEEFANAMIKGFKANNSEADVAKYQAQIDDLKKLMLSVGEARKGSKIQINFVPGAGTRVLFNGQQKGHDIAGDDFYQALLKIWLGDNPVDSDLKKALVGKAS